MGRVSQEEVSMPTDDVLESVRVIKKSEAQRLTAVSPDTWDRMERRGETPPITRISERRVGIRMTDLREWLDARREGRKGKYA